MTKTVHRIAEKARLLSDMERLELIEALFSQMTGIAADENDPSADMKAELDGRLAHMDAHPEDSVPVEMAVAHVKEHLRRKRG